MNKNMEAQFSETDFSRDHWSTLAFIETQIVDKKLPLDPRRLRINEKKRGFSNGNIGSWNDSYSTKKAGQLVIGHDDIDVIVDLEQAGYLINKGTLLNIIPQLTDKGWQVCQKLRQHIATPNNRLIDFKV